MNAGQNNSIFLLRLVLLMTALLMTSIQARDFSKARQDMVRAINRDVADTAFYIDKSVLDPRVMQVMGQVPRHRFVAPSMQENAYENRPLPIGHSQTISQPYIVALMTDLLDLDKDDTVLEVGTGSGYQAAVLASLVKQVYSMEIIEPLGTQAGSLLRRLGYANVEVMVRDGYNGWLEHAPFDAIMVTAAASHIPPPLIRQLKPGGRMMIPVGSQFQVQQLTLINKALDGTVTTRQVLPVRFVPLTGQH